MSKVILASTLLLFTGLQTMAQSHFKNVQATSVWSPVNVKIDGKVDEWEDHFQAYNKSTRLFYTLSNSEKYLYLAVTSTDAQNNTKIQAGGITLTINTAGKKREKNAFIITYPVISPSGRGQRGGGRFGRRQESAATDTAAEAAAHKQFIAASKEIKVFGFKNMDDSLISIYNEYGIKAAIGFDPVGSYNYELAIPLKVLGLSPDSLAEIAYNIKVNGLQLNAGIEGKVMLDNIQISGMGGGGRGGRGGRGGGDREKIDRAGSIDFADLTSPTDFWGKYTLAKNQ